MRLPFSLSGVAALFITAGAIGCAGPEDEGEFGEGSIEAGEEAGLELGVLEQAITGSTTETFSGTLAQGQTAARGPFAVQPGSQLRVTLSGSGDADLYVRFGSRPTLSSYSCRPYLESSAEECLLTVPSSATTVFVDVRGYTASTYTLQVERVPPSSGGGTGGSGGSGGSSGGSGGSSGGSGGSSGGSGGSSGGGSGGSSGGGAGSPIVETFSGSVARNATASRGPLSVQPGSRLRVALSGTGDADLYVKFGSRPTLSSYDCRPYEESSAEECVLTVPSSASSVYVDVHGYTASTYSLRIERVAGSGGSGSGGSGSGGSGSGGSGSGGSGSGGGSGGSGTQPFVIAVLGSSTAEGEGASSFGNSWVGLLEAELSEVANVSITNLAMGGYTTVELLPGSGASGSVDEAIAEDPDLLVVALAGSNDLSNGTSASTYLSRLTQVRDRARAAGIPTFFVGTAPKDLSSSERSALQSWNTQMRSRFSSCWVPATSSYSPCFIDVFADLASSDLNIRSQYDSGDGIHLNNAGHAVIFNKAINIVEPYLCTVRACD